MDCCRTFCVSLRRTGRRLVRGVVDGQEAVHGCDGRPMGKRLLGGLVTRTSQARAVKGLRLCDIIMAHSRRIGGRLSPLRFGRPVIVGTPIMLAVYTSFGHAMG